MYLKLDEINDVKDIPDNFDKAYLWKGGCNYMRALKNWNIGYLKEKFRNNLFRIELYDNYKNFSQTKALEIKKMKFNDFSKTLTSFEKPYHYLAEINLLDYRYLIDNNIFNDILSNYDYIRPPYQQLIFLGNNSRSGCHIHCIHDYVLNQIIGKKIVYLFNFNDNPSLKLDNPFFGKHNFLKKNFFELDHSKYVVYKVVLNPGDSLLIPPWWFHAVEGIDLSCSITKVYLRKDYSFMNEYKSLILLNKVQDTYSYIKHFYDKLILILVMFIISILILIKKKNK